MENYNLKNLTNKKIAIDCNSWEMSKQVGELANKLYTDILILEGWLETMPFLAIVPTAQFMAFRTHYWVKSNGYELIPGDQFIRDNSLVAEAVSSPGTSGDSTVQQQDYIFDAGERFAKWLDKHREFHSLIWESIILKDAVSPFTEIYKLFQEEVLAGRA